MNDPATGRKRLGLAPVDTARFSLAHAAPARIKYPDGQNPPGWLIVIKPTLTGDESADVLRYHAEHPDFPHESTADQYFNESQWESYRKLGDHITGKLFDAGNGAGKIPFAEPAVPD